MNFVSSWATGKMQNPEHMQIFEGEKKKRLAPVRSLLTRRLTDETVERALRAALRDEQLTGNDLRTLQMEHQGNVVTHFILREIQRRKELTPRQPKKP